MAGWLQPVRLPAAASSHKENMRMYFIVLKSKGLQHRHPDEWRPRNGRPQRFTSNVTLKSLLLRAYGVKDYQLLGPGWLGSERYEIRATVPSAATKEQFNAMLRSLLQERFNLAIHHETKEMSVYELVVGKNGSKSKESNLSVRSPTIDSGSRLPRISECRTEMVFCRFRLVSL